MILVLCELFELDYILKKQTKRYSESHKELASLVTFPAMRESNARRQGGKNKKYNKHLFLSIFDKNRIIFIINKRIYL